jgi:hypothetical protein
LRGPGSVVYTAARPNHHDSRGGEQMMIKTVSGKTAAFLVRVAC